MGGEFICYAQGGRASISIAYNVALRGKEEERDGEEGEGWRERDGEEGEGWRGGRGMGRRERDGEQGRRMGRRGEGWGGGEKDGEEGYVAIMY